MDNYEKLIDRISRTSGLERSEIDRRVEAKKAKLSGLISKEGAAQIVAAELGINFDQERMKISELIEGMKKVNVTGKILKLNPVRTFSKSGKEGKVVSFLLADESSNIRTVLWDTNHISLIERGDLKEGSVIEISNGGVRNNELHLSSFADIKKSNQKIEKVVEAPSFVEKKILEIRTGDSLKSRSVVVNSFEPKYFEVCPECGKKAVLNKCQNHGDITPVKRALLNIVLDDGSETIRAVLFGEQINKLGLTDNEIFSVEEFKKAKSKILGEEKYFIGNVRNNQVVNVPEFIVSDIEEVNPQELVRELEAKAR